MKLPSGYGTVYKLSGNRRNPYRAVITDRWELDQNDRKKQIRKTIGYYPTKKEALAALAVFNQSPFDPSAVNITFSECYDKWSEEHFKDKADNTIKKYKAAYLICEPLKEKKMSEIKLNDIQHVADHSGKNTPTLRDYRNLLSGVFKYAIIHDYITPDQNKVKYLNINKAGNPNKRDHVPFTIDEVNKLWEHKEDTIYHTIILMLIYTGVRIGELLDLKKKNINLSEKWFDITDSKTAAGIRKVPIADKIFPYFQFWYNHSDSDYLLTSQKGRKFSYNHYFNEYWKPVMQDLNLYTIVIDEETGEVVIDPETNEPERRYHTPHDTRHTCVSMLAEAKVDKRQINKIVGHKGEGVGEIVYTHFEIQTLLDTINLI
jgi:integrase